MRIKYEPEDFRVRELLAEGVLIGHGEHRVYRVTKRKLTSLQAAEVLASAAGASSGDVGMCGLKDRQGITTQHMSLPRGKGVEVDDEDLRVETIGFCADGLTSEASTGNAFELIVRGLSRAELATVSQNVVSVRRVGLINYFDDQRFGNLRHNQGWIALDLLRGEVEGALKTLLTAASEYENPRSRSFKNALLHAWGDWAECRDIAGRFGQHHSLFEHLKKNPEDFAGAFYHVATRLRLIHLYAYQSHLWNRAVADFVRSHVPIEQRVVVDTREGPLVYPGGETALPLAPDATFRLPGPKLADVTDERQRALLADALAADRLVPAKFVIEGVSGFQLKGEDRPLFVEPRHLRIRPPERDPLNPPQSLVRVRFELPRGAYATLVVRRLLAERLGESERPARRAPRAERGPLRGVRSARAGDPRDQERSTRDRRAERERPPRDDRGAGERPVRPWERNSNREHPPRTEWRGPPRSGDRRDRGPAAGRAPREGERAPRSGGDRPWKPEAPRAGDRANGPRDDRRGPPRHRDGPGRGPRRPPPRRKPKHD